MIRNLVRMIRARSQVAASPVGAAKCLLIAVVVVASIFPVLNAHAARTASEILAPLKERLNHPPALDTIEARTRWHNEVVVGTSERAARQIFQLYAEGNLDGREFERALRDLPNRQDFLNHLQRAFFDGSLRHLRSSNALEVRAFLELYRDVVGPEGEPLFRLGGHSPTDAHGTGPELAGFHRSTGSIFADFSMIPSSDWFIIFVHEVLHSLDDRLWSAVHAYGNNPNVPQFAEWAKTANRVSQLNPERRRLLNEWVEAGLDRGLWAEYRAWAGTFAIYCSGVRDRLWPRIAWLEAMGGTRCGSASLPKIYAYLDARSKNPTEQIFSLPLIQDAIRTVRAESRASNRLPHLGNLKAIVAP